MGQKKKNSQKMVSKAKKESKVSHKSKAKEAIVSNTLQKKTKASMKNQLSKFYFDKKPPSRYTPEQIEERRQYIRNTILKSNQQFQEDLNSQWYSDHSSNEDYSSTPLYQMETLKESASLCPEFSDSQLQQQLQQQNQQQQQNSISCIYGSPHPRHVSFSSSGQQIYHLQIDRVPPGRDNPIFDIKKTWITQLMSKKPKKSSIKIQVDRKGGIEQFGGVQQSEQGNENDQQYFHQEQNIDPAILFDYNTYRVLYEDNKQHYIVNTSFSYTH